MRRLLTFLVAGILAAAAVVGSAATADDKRTLNIEIDNAFGLVEDSQVRVAGVPAGSVLNMGVNEDKRAVIEAEFELEGFDAFRKGSGEVDEDGHDPTGASCSAEPQSLIAEYFLDCQPGTEGEEYQDGETIPVEQNFIRVQEDLVRNVQREPFRERFRLILNTFGAGLAGRGDDLNAVIRRGVPALRQTRRVIGIMAEQRHTISQLNRDSDTILQHVAANREDVGRWISMARRTNEATSARRRELAAQFNRLPVFLGELRPTMAQLEGFIDEQRPLLGDLRRAAPHLRVLAERIGPFSRASRPSVESLGEASVVGRRALRKAGGTISALRDASQFVRPAAREAALLFSDLDDPARALEPDERAEAETGRGPGAGYTGFENIINYVYNQSRSVATFDELGYILRITINEAGGPCSSLPEIEYARAESPDQLHPDGPRSGPGADRHRCVSWLGPNQPGLTQDVPVPKYPPEVCPDGSTRPDICDPEDASGQTSRERRVADSERERSEPDADPRTEQPRSGGGTERRGGDGPTRRLTPELPKPLQDLLDLPDQLLNGSRGNGGIGDALGLGNGSGDRRGGSDRSAGNDLLDYLFAN